jgi:DNA-binding GntR family transcriptional regulator
MTTTRLPRLEQNSLAKRAYGELKAAILGGKFPPGSALAEVELAQALGISRTPVREALGRLRTDGLVEAVPGGGNVVRTLREGEVRELFLLRESLEQLAVKEWIANADRSGLDELERLLDEQRAAKRKGSVEAFLDADERFHIAISRQAGLSQTAEVLTSLRERMRQAGLGAIAHPDRLAHVLDEHTAIFNALKGADADRAGRSLQRHLTATRTAFETQRQGRSRPRRSAS